MKTEYFDIPAFAWKE